MPIEGLEYERRPVRAFGKRVTPATVQAVGIPATSTTEAAIRAQAAAAVVTEDLTTLPASSIIKQTVSKDPAVDQWLAAHPQYQNEMLKDSAYILDAAYSKDLFIWLKWAFIMAKWKMRGAPTPAAWKPESWQTDSGTVSRLT